MTALERADKIKAEAVAQLRECTATDDVEAIFAQMRDAIHAACIEHSNHELQRRRMAQSRMREAAAILRAALIVGGDLRVAATNALVLLEGNDR